jgi:hypothetical protein
MLGESVMGINYDSRAIGNARATHISGRAGVGMSELGFSLAWSLYPKSNDVFTIFGTWIWVSVMTNADKTPLVLGQAMPEVAWCDESRDGQPYDQHLMYRLALPNAQLLALEELRQGGSLVFRLDIRGNSHGPSGVRSIDDQLLMTVNVSDWSRVLREAGLADVLVVGVHMPIDGPDHVRAALNLVRKANEHLEFGHYSAAVAECRRAIESLWKSANLTDEAREARKSLSTMNGQLSMTKRDRELAMGEALRIFCHNAHHVGADAEPEMFGRMDAALAVSTTAALVSSLAALPDLVKSIYPKESAVAFDAKNKTQAPSEAAQDVPSLQSQIDKVRVYLQDNPKNRPRTMARLQTALKSLFSNRLDTVKVDKLISELIKLKWVEEIAGKLTYTHE